MHCSWLTATLFFFSGSSIVSAATKTPCSAEVIPPLDVYGTETISVNPTPVLNLSFPVPQGYSLPMNVMNLSFCNVAIQYTHPGYNDSINVQVWLPLRNWNSRFFGTGGGGWLGNLAPLSLIYPVSLGYATVATVTGHDPALLTPASWALISPGNINWPLHQNFADTAIDEATTIGKAVTVVFYKSPIKYSYFVACSQGGRFGLQLAQRHPTQYNGIVAIAPALKLSQSTKIYPPQCEFEALTLAATQACDALDGVIDNAIGAPEFCTFGPTTLINSTLPCPSANTTIRISSAAAAAWTGPCTVSGKYLGHGFGKDASLRNVINTTGGACGEAYHPPPYAPGSTWIPPFPKRNLSFDVYGIDRREYDALFRKSRAQFDSIIGSNDPDLTDFRDAGGRMIMWHGAQDDTIPAGNSLEYYKTVWKLDPGAAGYFRYILAPGVGHCVGRQGAFPYRQIEEITAWVEEGKALDVLEGVSLPDEVGRVRRAPLFPWPSVRGYKGGDIGDAASYQCREDF